MFAKLVLISVFFVSIVTPSAQALPLPPPGINASPLLDFLAPDFSGASVDFNAIVALSNCSGALIRFETSLDSDPGVVMTNGHCLGDGFLEPGEVVINSPVSRTMKLLSKDGRKTLAILHANLVLYGTMTKTDLALYRLTETFGEIEKKFQTRALTLSSRRPEAGREIAVASGYWKKIYSCSIDRFIPELREDRWVWKDAIRYTQPGCNTIHGTSGSPVIDAQTGEVVAINNTGNDNGEKCTMNNPCEVEADGTITVNHKASYAEQTYWVYGCLGSQGQLDLGRAGCELPKPKN